MLKLLVEASCLPEWDPRYTDNGGSHRMLLCFTTDCGTADEATDLASVRELVEQTHTPAIEEVFKDDAVVLAWTSTSRWRGKTLSASNGVVCMQGA